MRVVRVAGGVRCFTERAWRRWVWRCRLERWLRWAFVVLWWQVACLVLVALAERPPA